MISGIFLHGSKIISHARYQEMVQEYTILTDAQELKALEAYWVDKYGVVSPNVKGPFDAAILEQGKLLNEMSCLECHSRPQSAFLSYGSALLMRPAALALDKAHLPTLLWYLHFLFCFAGLAYLPFSRMFHIFASPVSLMVNAVMEKGKSDPANVATRQVMELDACTHCGTCSTRCSVGVVSEEIPNVNILPSEKIASIKALASGKELGARELRALQEGVYLCTSCYRCTVACPSGINLQDLWFSVRETLLAKGHPEFLTLSPFSLSRGLIKDLIEPTRYRQPVERALESMVPKESLVQLQERAPVAFPSGDGLSTRLRASLQAVNFADCFRCRTCSNACPVVGSYERPATMLGLLPHQIMHSVALRLWDLIFSSKMLWYCLGCYQCQEHCPQSVHVTEILYELKNMAIAQATRSLSEEKKGE
jgi:heterodisulfide reductase subunit C